MDRMPYDMLRIAGIQSNKGWIPYPKWVVPGSFNVSQPSYTFKFTYVDHFFSKKYFRLVKKHKPELVAEVMKLLLLNKIASTSWEEVMNKRIAERIKELKEREKYILERENEVYRREREVKEKELEILKKENEFKTGVSIKPKKKILSEEDLTSWKDVYTTLLPYLQKGGKK